MAGVTLWDGVVEQPTELTVWDGAAEVPVLDVGVMPSGYQTYSQMTAAQPFAIAHRGGSANWPEMSMFAYTQAVAWGMPVLEFSCGRSVDGVWLGVHDQTLNRTSGVTGLPAVSTMTWAEISGYRVNQHGRSEPYSRLEEVLDRYSASHLFFIDPKYSVSGAYLAELYAIIKNFPGWEKHVIKYYWDSVGVPQTARTAGFRTWGYYYAADADQIAETHGRWDLLGMEIGATQAAWDLALAPGKPVVAHLATTTAHATEALARGAHGMMMPGVKQILGTPKIFEAGP